VCLRPASPGSGGWHRGPRGAGGLASGDIGAAGLLLARGRDRWGPEMNESTTTAAGTSSPPGTATPGGRALVVYRWALAVFLAAGVVQIFLAGLGTFKLLHGAGDPAMDPHRMLGFAMAGGAIIILILTLIARPGRRAIVGAVLLVLTTSFLQSLLAGLADDHVIFGALHATDGLLILAIPAYLYVWSGRRAS